MDRQPGEIGLTAKIGPILAVLCKQPITGLAPDTGGLAPDTGGLAPNTGGLAPDTEGLAPDTGGLAPDTGGLAPDTGGLAPHTGAAAKYFFQDLNNWILDYDSKYLSNETHYPQVTMSIIPFLRNYYGDKLGRLSMYNFIRLAEYL